MTMDSDVGVSSPQEEGPFSTNADSQLRASSEHMDPDENHPNGDEYKKQNRASRLEKLTTTHREKNLQILKIFNRDKELVNPSTEYSMGQLKLMLQQINSSVPNSGLTLENFRLLYPENSMCCGSLWNVKNAEKGAELPYNILVELFLARKPNSPEYFVTRIGDTKYIVYTAWIQDKYDLRKRRPQAHQL